MTAAIILLGVALIVSLAFNFGFFNKHDAPAVSSGNNAPSPRLERGEDAGGAKLESELDKKRKELEEIKRANAELKDELKTVKKKIHDNKEAGRSGDDLSKARAEAERQASIQLDNTRHELSNALADVTRLKSQLDAKGRKPRDERPAPAVEKSDEPKPQVVITKVIRELSDVEKEKMARLEQQSSTDKKKAIELSVEIRSIKARIDREKREAKRIYEEGRLSRDKYRAVEIRLNRTLLEADMLRRAVSDLEKKTGQHADRTQLTTEEVAASDQHMKDKYAAEDKAAEEAQHKLEAAEAKAEDDRLAAVAAAAAAAAAPAPSTEPVAATTSSVPAENPATSEAPPAATPT